MAARFCFIDYDRELALCAEVMQGQKRLLVGVARLVADLDHENGEYGVLVADDFQHRGLGSLLTKRCIEIARRWHLRRLSVKQRQAIWP